MNEKDKQRLEAILAGVIALWRQTVPNPWDRGPWTDPTPVYKAVQTAAGRYGVILTSEQVKEFILNVDELPEAIYFQKK